MKLTTWQSEKTGLWWGRIMAGNGEQLARTSRGWGSNKSASAFIGYMHGEPRLYQDRRDEWRWFWFSFEYRLISSEGYKEKVPCQYAADLVEVFLREVLPR